MEKNILLSLNIASSSATTRISEFDLVLKMYVTREWHYEKASISFFFSHLSSFSVTYAYSSHSYLPFLLFFPASGLVLFHMSESYFFI